MNSCNIHLFPKGRSQATKCWYQQSLFLTVRLGGDIYSSEGLVEVYYNKTWGGICDQQWNKQDADVVCRELGFRNAILIYSSPANEGDTMWINNLQCSGDEMSLVLCVHDGWKKQSCPSGRHAGVVCKVPEGRLVTFPEQKRVFMRNRFVHSYYNLLVIPY